MKKFVFIVCSVVLSISACIASNSASKTTLATTTTSTASVSVPTGVYFNGYDFVKVESTWVRIKIGQGSNEYSFRAETNPLGCVLRLLDRNGNEVGIISISGNKLVYNGTTYSKK